MQRVTHLALILVIAGTGVFGILGFSSSSAAQDTPSGTSPVAAVITQVGRTNKLTEVKLPPDFAEDALSVPDGAGHVFIRGFVSEQPHDVVALQIYRAMLQRGYRFAFPNATKPYQVDDVLIDAVYLKKGSADILVQSAAVVGPYGDLTFYTRYWRSQDRFLAEVKGHKTYVQFYGGQGYYDGHFAASLSD